MYTFKSLSFLFPKSKNIDPFQILNKCFKSSALTYYVPYLQLILILKYIKYIYFIYKIFLLKLCPRERHIGSTVSSSATKHQSPIWAPVCACWPTQHPLLWPGKKRRVTPVLHVLHPLRNPMKQSVLLPHFLSADDDILNFSLKIYLFAKQNCRETVR